MDQNNAYVVSGLALMRLNSKLIGLVREKEAVDPAAPLSGMKMARVSAAILGVLTELGISLAPKTQREEQAFELEGGPEPVAARTPTAKFFDFDPNRKHGDRKKDNAAAMELLAKIDAGEVDGNALTDAQKETLARYSGTGGNLVGADGKKGSAYEYYTPKPIAAGMWDLLGELGFKGGKVLDPCAGVGIFGATSPANVAMDTVELNETSGRVNRLVNGGPGYSATISPFEAVASRTPDEIYDAVVTNVPFGGVHDRGANRKMDERYQDEPLETYFILRSLEKLKPGGLAAFIVPPRIVSAKGGREERLRIAMSYLAEFMGAYRLPNSVFGTADADTITDVIVLRKYGREALTKIAELTEQNPSVLVQAKVQWTEFISGDYFRGEGKRFVLGEFVPKDPTKFRDVDRVISDQSVANIAKLMRKFPGSRVDWALLDATETEPIEYREGDTITMAGQTLQMQDGRWVALGAAQSDSRFDELGQVLTSPLVAVSNGVDWTQASDYVGYLRERSMDVQMPDWLRLAYRDLQNVEAAERPNLWQALIAGLATVAVYQEHGGTPGFKYAEEYPVLNDVIPKIAATARKAPAVWSRDSKAALVKIGIVYDRKTGFSDVWLGKVKADVMDGQVLDEEAQVKAIKYRTQGVELDVADLKAIYGDAFDPLADDNWCVNADGTRATKADDYYIGNLAEFVTKIDAQIAQAPEGALRDKLIRQKDLARERISVVDPTELRFNLFSPFVTMEEKAEFLRRFAGPGFAVATNNNGDPYIVYEGKDDTTEQRLFSRIASYVSGNAGGTGVRSLTLQGKSVGLSEKDALAALRGMASRLNTQFDGYVKSVPVIMERLREQANDPSRLYFTEVEDGSPVDIEGVNKEWQFHGYQNSFIRKQARSFGGINGFDVGGGKAQDVNEPVLTPDGWKRMGDIKVGDMVIAVDGSPTKVTGVFPQGIKPSYEITFHDGSKARSCDEHLWFTLTETDRATERRYLKAGKPVPAVGSVKSLKDIMGTLRRGSLKNHSIPMVAPVQFPEQALAVHPYLMGVILGDGSVPERGAAFWHKPDRFLADRVCNLSLDAIAVREVEQGERCTKWKLDGESGLRATHAMREMGLTGLHSHEKLIPDAYMLGSIGQRVDLLRGLMDTDGYASANGSHIQFTSTSRKLAEQVRELVMSLGGNAWISSKVPTFTYKGEKKEGRLAHTVSLRMPPDINPFSLPRKADRAKPRTKYTPNRLIDTVELVDHVESQCIRVEHPSHLYITRDYVVTHNTATAAACIQYVHAIGVKKKTMVVVPNTVLSNWRKELVTGAGKPGEPGYKAPVFSSGDDCLFIGLDINPKTGKATVDSANYARDFERIRENKHRKIFCTMEAFKAIPLKAETIEAYDRYLMEVDPAYASSDKKAESERADSKRSEATSGTGAKSSAIPYFEDMGIDSLVLDEAHAYKNSKQTIEFSGAKFLSVSEASQRGLDIQIKAWFIRGLTPAGDGVLSLTATPITNSPLEIYSMLTLAAGEKKVHDLCMGIRGADDFMDTMCVIEEDEEVAIDGTHRNYKVFRGLQNVSLLRTALQSIATIKDADDFRAEGQDIVLPDASERATAVSLPQPVLDKLNEYKMAYRAARALMKEENPLPEEMEAMERIQARYGESEELIGHPFNLINKMTLLIADPELDERASFYTFLPAQAELAKKVVDTFNGLKKHEFRSLPGPMTQPEAVVGTKTVRDGDDVTVLQKIHVMARILPDGRIALDSMDKTMQSEFEKQADKAGLDLDCSVPPKIAALLENVRHEEAHPRSKSGRVKQLIFCDVLPLHNKIKRVLVKRAGFLASQIVFITGVDIKNPEQMQGIQDGFNAEGEENLYRAVIANEKAEVGINLQKGTQAIHHLTIGWTPDSQIQRNGRGVRQGNTTETVHVYHYDADGTFDEYKRKLTSKKSDWISAVMDKNGGNEVAVAGGLTNEQYEEMIESMGDAGALQGIRERAEMRERLARAESARAKQVINLQTAKSQSEYLQKYEKITAWVRDKMLAIYDMQLALADLQKRRTITKNAGSLVRLEARIADLEARIKGMRSEVESSVKFKVRGGEQSLDYMLTPASYIKAANKRREDVAYKVTRTVDVVVDEQSALYQDWASERDAARAMVDEAYKDFERIAGSGEGGYPAQVVQAMRNGEGVIIDGRVYCRGMFARKEDGTLYVIAGREFAYRFGASPVTVQSLVNGKYRIIVPGTADYDKALSEAAAIDDAATNVTDNNREYLFGAVVPEVAERRTTKTMVRYSRESYMLPAPLFPFAINPDAEGISDGMRSIGRSQMSVVKEWIGRDFVAESSVAVERMYGGSSERLKSLVNYVKANSIKITAADLAYSHYGDASKSDYVGHLVREACTPDWPTTDDAGQRWAQCKTVAELQAEAAKMMAAAMTWLDAAGFDFADIAPVMIRLSYNDRAARIAREEAMAEAARKAAEIAAAGTPAAPEATEQTPTAADQLNAAVWVKPSNGEVRVYFNGVKSGAKAYVGKFASDQDEDTDWYVTVVSSTKYGSLMPGVREAVLADVDARISKVFGGTRPTLGQLIQAAGGVPDAADTSGIEEVGGVAPNARGMVGITGKTKENMGIIKACAAKVGGSAKWNGQAVRWEVPATAWLMLQENHPAAAKELQVVPC